MDIGSCRNVKNCLSIDVEGFVEANLQSFKIDKKYIEKNKENYEIEKNMGFILKLLSDLNITATFFFLGRVARELPCIVKEVAKVGHEIASHNYEHLQIPGINRKEFKNKLNDSKKYLEDISGKRVCGFRAPDFSISKSSIWALDILKEIGFIYDSSIYPSGLNSILGIEDGKYYLKKMPNGIIEFPPSCLELFGKNIPFGGGGYFRFYPIFFTRFCIKKTNKIGYPCMLYIHPYEVGSLIHKIPGLSFYRKIRHYYNCQNGEIRLRQLLKEFNFRPTIEILKERGLF